MSDELPDEQDLADELHYLRWFYSNADFGPAEGDVRIYLNERYVEEEGRPVPTGYNEEEA